MSEDRTSFQALMEQLLPSVGADRFRRISPDDWMLSLAGGAVEVNVSYREASGQVVTSAVVAPFQPSVDAEGRARALLEMNWQWRESHGFTVGVDDEMSVLMVADRRSARRFGSAEALGAYLADAVGLVRDLRADLAEFEALADCLEAETFGEEPGRGED